MKTKILLAGVTAGVMFAGSVLASTLDDVRARGKLNCIINTGLAGFAAPDDKGNWTGFDVDFCRAVAAATLGDADKVNYTTATGKTRFTKLAAGEGELLSRNTTWTFSRDVDLSQTFIGVNYYDGQGFMVPKSLGVKSAKGLDGASVCIQTGTTTELNLAEFQLEAVARIVGSAFLDAEFLVVGGLKLGHRKLKCRDQFLWVPSVFGIDGQPEPQFASKSLTDPMDEQ